MNYLKLYEAGGVRITLEQRDGGDYFVKTQTGRGNSLVTIRDRCFGDDRKMADRAFDLEAAWAVGDGE
jgi:hypothetical protein